MTVAKQDPSQQTVTDGKALLDENPKRTAEVALMVFFNVMNAWKANTASQCALLGNPAESTMFNWKKGKTPARLSQDVQTRISLVLGIYKAIGILMPIRERADAWVNRPNSTFGGLTALEHMSKGNILNMVEMRRYLDAQRG
ncbi:MbcA/ParS/Xre antitoxin family protein [Neiella marina]|uniref:MbcA/ParS/Xre antitoxin family protein n=1 Tax=Neiella holothuriorum TaxID=2870530 RepID=A0ABS7EIV3_9GAMM|nr:antitoxin Xre/MbcA/ParS toxin-binding domain-containing protein [Neiella holothuriorum]MBW8191813.1 MbcA/ParS/Xre antitoxin family protein [Neiella holothuriorum]